MSHERPDRINVAAIKQAVDLLELARRYTSLKQISRAGEYAGPCPRCGGEDRFHIKDNRFYCRQCYPLGGDVIDLVRLAENVNFLEACEILATGVPFFSERQSSPSSQQQQSHDAGTLPPVEQTEAFFESARKTVAATSRRLFSANGGAGRAYLQQRGLSETTWRTFQLGYGTTFHPLHQKNEPAIFIPWLSADGQRVEALRHRFITPDLAKQERYSLKPGSHTVIFGLHALRLAQCLVVVEGEFNCMALHQVGLMAISLGSQTGAQHHATLERLLELLPPYPEIIVWFDDPQQGQRLADRLVEAEPFRKEKVQALASHSLDANEMLRQGELLTYLAAHGITPDTE